MSRRSRFRRRGEHQVALARRVALPPTHEGVRRFSAARSQPFSTAGAADKYLRQLRRTVLAGTLAKPAVGRLSRPRLYSWSTSLSMRVPRKVAFCVLRKERREVLHALNIAGSRGLGGGRFGYRRTQNSQYSC